MGNFTKITAESIAAGPLAVGNPLPLTPGLSAASKPVVGIPTVLRMLTYFGKREVEPGLIDNLYQGYIARIGIYTYCLTPEQITDHFESQDSADYSIIVERDAPEGYLICDDSGTYGIVENYIAEIAPLPTGDISYQVQISDLPDFSASGTTQVSGQLGPEFPTATGTDGTGPSWDNTDNIMAEDGLFATLTLPVPPDGNVPSSYLQALNIVFPGIPPEVEINGLLIEVKRYATGILSERPSAVYMTVQPIGVGGSPKGDAFGDPVGATLAWVGYGGQNDNFGATLDAPTLGTTGLGINIWCQCTGAPGQGAFVYVDAVRATVFYGGTALVGLTAVVSANVFALPDDIFE